MKHLSLRILIARYIKAANALNRYRESNGFMPGAKVVAKWRDAPAKTGVIAPYGEHWSSVDHMSVPVLLDSGRCQPWNMRDLEIAG